MFPCISIDTPITNLEVTDNSVSDLIEGTNTVSVRCSVTGGKPEPTLTLTCDGTTHSSTSSGNVFTAVISTYAERGLNGKACTCSGNQLNNQWSETKDSGIFNIKCKIVCLNKIF